MHEIGNKNHIQEHVSKCMKNMLEKNFKYRKRIEKTTK